jgi:hypothetical protein
LTTDPLAVRDVFASHYFLFAFLASLGTIQIAVTISGARGLWLTPHMTVTRWLGIALIITGVLIFFGQPLWIEGPWAEGSVEADSSTRAWGQSSWNELAGARNVNDIHGGLDGTRQAIWFPLAAMLAVAVSAIFGSFTIRILRAMERVSGDPEHFDDEADGDGIEGLTHRSFLSNLPISFRKFRVEIKDVWRSGLTIADRWSVFKLIFGRTQGS